MLTMKLHELHLIGYVSIGFNHYPEFSHVTKVCHSTKLTFKYKNMYMFGLNNKGRHVELRKMQKRFKKETIIRLISRIKAKIHPEALLNQAMKRSMWDRSK